MNHQHLRIAGLAGLLLLVPALRAQSVSCAGYGAWSATTTYAAGTQVTYQGSLYQALVSTTNVPPNYCLTCGWWQLLGTCGTTPACAASPSVPSGLSASNITSSSASLAWNAATAGSGCTVTYSVYQNGAVVISGLTGTSTTLSGLNANTSYTIAVASADAAGSSAQSPSITLKPTPLTCAAAPSVPTGLACANVTSTGLTLSWNASTVGASCTATYTVYQNSSPLTSGLTGTSATITGLTSSTAYTFTVAAVDAAGSSSQSGSLVVTTSGNSTGTCSGIAAWNATGIYTTGMQVTYNGKLYKAKWWTQNEAPGAGGDWGVWQYLSDCSLVACSAAPSVPAGLNAANVTSSGLTLSWSAATAGSGCSVSYVVYQNGSAIVTGLTGTSANVSGLTAGTSYSFTVAAVDATGSSAQSAAKSVTTSNPCTPTAITPYLTINGGAWQQTASASLAAGGSVSFGPQPLDGGSWSWSGPSSFSSSSREVSLSNVQTSQAGNYVATYTNAGGCKSTQTFTVSLSAAVVITTQPANQKVTTGSTATFWVKASAASAITYQWKKNGTAISGATSFRYTTPVTTSADGASFSVIVTSGGASTTSNAATLTILSDIDDLMGRAGGQSWSSSTPMGGHYQGRHVTTDSDRSYLNDAGNQPPIPSGHESDLHLKSFAVNLFPSGSPNPTDINQHNLGDCNGITALGAMAYMVPEFVKGLITDNGGGVFTVAMFDPQGQPITLKVDSQFLADGSGNLAAVSGKNDAATWSTVLEKAIMKYNVIYQADGTIEGIGSENVTPLFTGAGSSFAFDRGALSPAEMSRVIKASLACGKFISGGFGAEITLGNIYSVTGHGYACYWPSNDATMISMRNPWGVNPIINGGGYDSSTDGLLNIPSSTTWSQTIDLRVIDSGIAGTAGRTTPWTPPTKNLLVPQAVRLSPAVANVKAK